jgi:hypothetical protein
MGVLLCVGCRCKLRENVLTKRVCSMANKPEPSPLSKLVDKALENTVGLFLVFFLSSALIGGMAYILFGSRAEMTEIIKEPSDYLDSAEQYSDVKKMYDTYSDYYLDNVRLWEIEDAVLAGLNYQINGDYVVKASKWCKDTASKYMRLKPKIEAIVVADPLKVRLQSNMAQSVEYRIAEVDLLSDALTNWNQASMTQRGNYYMELAKIAREITDVTNAITIQFDQVTQRVDTQTQEMGRVMGTMSSNLEMWRTRRDLASIGIGIGLLTLFGLFILLLYKVRHK